MKFEDMLNLPLIIIFILIASLNEELNIIMAIIGSIYISFIVANESIEEKRYLDSFIIILITSGSLIIIFDIFSYFILMKNIISGIYFSIFITGLIKKGFIYQNKTALRIISIIALTLTVFSFINSISTNNYLKSVTEIGASEADTLLESNQYQAEYNEDDTNIYTNIYDDIDIQFIGKIARHIANNASLQSRIFEIFTIDNGGDQLTLFNPVFNTLILMTRSIEKGDLYTSEDIKYQLKLNNIYTTAYFNIPDSNNIDTRILYDNKICKGIIDEVDSVKGFVSVTFPCLTDFFNKDNVEFVYKSGNSEADFYVNMENVTIMTSSIFSEREPEPIPTDIPVVTKTPYVTITKTPVTSSKDRYSKTLLVGESWDVYGSEYTITVNSVDAKTLPKQVWFSLLKNGQKLDDIVINEGEIYKFTTKSGDIIFKTKIAKIYSDSSYDSVTFTDTSYS